MAYSITSLASASSLSRLRGLKIDDQLDALEFPDGRIVLLTCLMEGQVATVLQLPASVGIAEQRNGACNCQLSLTKVSANWQSTWAMTF
jgi:hypothetical protein